MKNLKLLVNIKHSVEGLVNSEQFAVASADYNNNIFNRKGYVFVYKENDIFILNSVSGNCSLLFSIKHLVPSGSTIVSLFYNSVINLLNVALENGDVLSVTLNDDLSPMDTEAQIVGTIGSGLKAVALSPDTEIIIFLTGDNTLIFMSGNFDLLEEVDLFGPDHGEQEMVNVGWGKKETQFHGSEGKGAAKKKISEEEIIMHSNTSSYDRKPKIAWRGDSSLFAVIYWCPDKNHQKVKIFNKAGRLQCTSEILTGLENVLSWRPSGNLMALAQKLPNKHVICFLEKNGLRHGDFTLPPNINILDLSWNSESTILSAVCVDESVNQPCVLLWTTSNYHWYLKQRLNFRSTVVGLVWDEVVGNLAHIILADGQYLALQWSWTVDHSTGMVEDDLAVVAVIDGCDIKLTALKKCVIPPPMCSATVQLPSPALQVAFSPYCGISDAELSPNDLFVYMCDGQLAFIKGMASTPQLHCVLPVRWQCPELPCPSHVSLSHWLWMIPDQLICVCGVHLCHLHIDQHAATVVSTTLLEEAVLTVTHQPGSCAALVQTCSGALLVYQDGCLTPSSTLPEPCLAIRSTQKRTFSRTHNNHLYVDGDLIANNVTSFFCLPDFLVMTLSNHQLQVTSENSGFKICADVGVASRRVERGSSLVLVTGHSVILQMPRGNLETVQPRALTLVTAGQLLDSGDYKAGVQLLRRQRIDLNLCVDHNPSAFMLGVSRLVGQVRDPQWLSVFLAELSERDVTRSAYSDFYQHLKGRGAGLPDKVVRVCSALRQVMTQTPEDSQLFLQPILSSYVREGRVGEAIVRAESDEALGYLALLIDTDTLYEEALGIYNLEKALKIAGKSLKDPKEYVPYLNELRDMDPAYMRFTIDKRLHRPESALRNLVQCDDRAAECLRYVQDTALYTLALQLFKEKPEMYKEVCLLYGRHLEEGRSYEEAGLMFRRGGDVSKALAAYCRAGCWQHCLTLAAQHQCSAQEVGETLYTQLGSRQRYADAGALSEALGWSERAVGCWLSARHWAQALYLCHTRQLAHLIDDSVKPALLECQGQILSDLRAKKDEMSKHSARLVVVRERKAHPEQFGSMSDMHSDTSSLSSFSTSSAGTRTTKNTRKAQRKLWSLKEGNPREEQALLYTLTELIQGVERLTGEVQTTCLALAELGLDSEASCLHDAMAAGLTHVEAIKHATWPACAVKKSGSDAGAIDPTALDSQLSFPPTSCVSSSWKLSIYS